MIAPPTRPLRLRLRHMLTALACGFAVAAPGGAAAAPSRPRIGVYYFPGWLRSDWAPKGTWDPIRPYPGLKPLLGWYDQASPAVLARQLRWMAAYGIDYVVMDWYHEQGAVRLDEGLKAYLAVPQTAVKLSLLWANHGETTTPAIWRDVVQIWIDRYLRLPQFVVRDGRPVVFVFSYDKLAADAAKSGSSARAYVATAQGMAKAAGLPGLYLTAGLDDFSPAQVHAGAMVAGFDAVSTYQFHRKPQAASATDPDWGRPTHGWAQLATAYRTQWQEGLKLGIPMVVPMISGLDRRPWGGFAGDPLHDRSIASPAQFRTHLVAARGVMAQQGARGSGLGVICCWNEFGEGAFIEPTKGNGFSQLEAVRRVFGRGGVSPGARRVRSASPHTRPGSAAR